MALAAIVGNEDGAHHISAIVFLVLNDVEFSLAASAVNYWNVEAQGDACDYKDLDPFPDSVLSTGKKAAANAVHLARLLKGSPYPTV